MRCLFCGYENEENALFCEKCGKPIEKPAQSMGAFCPECGMKNGADALFCEGCGTRLREEVREETTARKSKAPVIAAAIIVVVIACLGAGALFIHMKNKSERSDIAKEEIEKAEEKEAKSDDEDIVEKQESEEKDKEERDKEDRDEEDTELVSEEPETIQEQQTPEPVQAPVITMQNISSVSASSELAEANMVHSSSRIMDGDKNTAWVEGVNGQGYGQSVRFQFNGTYLVNGIRIRAGYQKNDDIYYKNSRPKEISVEFSDGTSEIIWLEDLGQAEQAVSFSHAVETDMVNLVIQSVYSGNKYEDTCISDLVFF